MLNPPHDSPRCVAYLVLFSLGGISHDELPDFSTLSHPEVVTDKDLIFLQSQVGINKTRSMQEGWNLGVIYLEVIKYIPDATDLLSYAVPSMPPACTCAIVCLNIFQS